MTLEECGIEKFEIVDVYVPDIESDDDAIYNLEMHETNLDTEIYCTSKYPNNLELIKQLLEKNYA